MSRKIFFYCLFLLFSLPVFAQTGDQTAKNPATSVCTRPLVVGWTDYPPFQNTSPKANATMPIGLEIELLNKIGQNLGCTFTFKKIPFPRQFFDLRLGAIDLIFSNAQGNDIDKDAYSSVPYRTTTIHLFVRQNEVDKYKISTLNDLKNTQMVLGIKRGFYYGPELTAALNDPDFKSHFEESTYSIMNLKKLYYGRIDGVLMEIPVLREFEKHIEVSESTSMHPFVLYKGSVRILFSKKTMNSNIVDAFNAQIEQLQKDDTIKKLMDKFGVEEK
jgi:polar amino acid transport system substrate-binding protein